MMAGVGFEWRLSGESCWRRLHQRVSQRRKINKLYPFPAKIALYLCARKTSLLVPTTPQRSAITNFRPRTFGQGANGVEEPTQWHLSQRKRLHLGRSARGYFSIDVPVLCLVQSSAAHYF